MVQPDPIGAADEAIARISAGRRLRRNGRLYTGDAAATRLNQGALAEPAPVARSIAMVPLAGSYETPAPPPLWQRPAPPPAGNPGASRFSGVLDGIGHAQDLGHNAFEDVIDRVYWRDRALSAQAANAPKIESAIAGGGAGAADPWTEPFQPRQQQAAPPSLAAPQLLLPPARSANHALNTQAANAPKIEAAIAGAQTQPMAIGSGGAVLDPVAADPAARRQPAPHVALGYEQSGGNVLDTLLNAASTVADPVLTNASGGGPGTSTAKGNQLIDAKLNERINAFLGRGTPAGGPVQLPLTTGFRAGGGTTAPAAAPAAPAAPAGGGGAGGAGLRQAGQRLRSAVSGATTPAFGAVDLGVGRLLGNQLDDLAKTELIAQAPQAAHAMRGLARGARVLAPAAALAAPLIPVAMGAAEGYQDAGAGGALIQGGSAALGGVAGGALAGALAGSVVPGFGTVIGGILGGLGGMALGKGVTGMAKGAVDAAQGGDTGLMGQLGRALDPVIDTDNERQQQQIMREMNSPAMKAVQLQQEQREAKARADQARAVLLQSYLS